MKPVNLLPQGSRPYVSSGGKGGTAYAALAVLALLVVAAVAYVLTSNKIDDSHAKIAKANAEAAQAQARVSSLASYASFNKVASTRIATVGTLAIGRIDYERLVRETALVLPAGVWLSSLDAEAGTGVSSATSATGAAPAAAAGTPSAGPTVHVNGCAKTQDDVATTLVRLRAIHGSDDVTLTSSGKELTTAATAAAGGGGSTTGCGDGYSWDIMVTLKPTTITGLGDFGQKVPVTLGGGS